MKTNKLKQANLDPLIKQINITVEKSHEDARRLLQAEKLKMHHTIGKHIKTHLLKNKDRADYASKLFTELASQTSISQTDLYLSLRLYEEYPQIFRAPEKLTWTHFTHLIGVKNPKDRQEIEAEITSQNLSTRALKNRIKEKKYTQKRKKTTLTTTRDTPYTYRTKMVRDTLNIDLGFMQLITSPSPTLNTKSIYKSEKTNTTYTFTNTDTTTTPYYTYEAYVLEILDGDTIWVMVELGFNCRTPQKLRLRAIDTPPLSEPAGKKAKAYVEDKLKIDSKIAIKTYARDKFDRYLTDIFYLKGEKNLKKIIQTGHFLNQELLDTKRAKAYLK